MLLFDVIVVVLGCISVVCLTGHCFFQSLDFVSVECLLLNDVRAVLIVKTGHACGTGGARHSLVFANRHTVIVQSLSSGLAASGMVCDHALGGRAWVSLHVLQLLVVMHHEVIR